MWWNGVHKVPSCGKFEPQRRDARKVRRNVGTTRSRCIFIPDGADAADESGYVGSLLPFFVSPAVSRRRSLTAARRLRFPDHLSLIRPTQSSFPLLPLSRPQSQFYFGPSEDGIFRHTGVRPNAAIHHPRCNTPYNVLCRMVNPSSILMLLPKQPSTILFFTKGYIMRRSIALKADSSKIFSLEESPQSRLNGIIMIVIIINCDISILIFLENACTLCEGNISQIFTFIKVQWNLLEI